MDQWYYALNGAQQGPVSKAALMQLIVSGQVSGDTLVWREGMGDWVAANTIPELIAPAQQPYAAVRSPNPTGQYTSPAPMLSYGVGDSIYQPGGVSFNYAGFWIRFAAFFIDLIILMVAGATVGAVIGGVMGAAMGNTRNMILAVQGVSNTVGILINWLYFAFMLSSTRQASVGQMAVGIRVVDLNGQRISFARGTGRYFASILSGCLVGVGYLMMLWSPRKQTLHDQIAGTIVLMK